MVSRLPSKRQPKPPKPIKRKKHAPPPPLEKFWNPAFAEVARVMAVAGRTNAEIAERLGVSEKHFYKWKNENPDLGKALIEGREGAYEAVESATLRAILGGPKIERTMVPDRATGELKLTRMVTSEIMPNGELGLKWLERRNRERWRPPAEEKNVNVTFRKALMELAELDPDD